MGFLSFGKQWKLAALAAAVLSVGGYGLFWLRRASAPQVLGLAVREVSTDRRVMALTFDDGPHPQSTRQILALLKQHDAKATFFVVGQHAQTHGDIIQEIYRAGHELGNHSWDHRHLIYHRPSFVRWQIDSTDQLLRKLGYQGPIPFRAPYGHKLFVLPYVLWRSQRPHILWGIELDDWDSPPPAEMLARFDEQAGPGKILLLHDGSIGQPQSREATTKLLALILEKYQAQGYVFVTISELLKMGRLPAPYSQPNLVAAK